jgi:hypothetical protein
VFGLSGVEFFALFQGLVSFVQSPATLATRLLPCLAMITGRLDRSCPGIKAVDAEPYPQAGRDIAGGCGRAVRSPGVLPVAARERQDKQPHLVDFATLRGGIGAYVAHDLEQPNELKAYEILYALWFATRTLHLHFSPGSPFTFDDPCFRHFDRLAGIGPNCVSAPNRVVALAPADTADCHPGV